MERGMEILESAYSVLFTVMLIALAILVMLCLVRAIIGPRVADRIVSVNMTGTMVIVMIAILALMLEEGYLVDICLIYAMISFLAVIVLVKVYMGVYLVGKRVETAEDSVARIEGIKQNGTEPGDCERQSGSEEPESHKRQSDCRNECGAVQQSENMESSGEKEDKDVVKQGKARKEDAE